MSDKSPAIDYLTCSAGLPFAAREDLRFFVPSLCLAEVSDQNDGGERRVHVNLRPIFVTYLEAAVLLTTSRRTIRHLVLQGKLKRCQVGTEWHITWDSVVALAGLVK